MIKKTKVYRKSVLCNSIRFDSRCLRNAFPKIINVALIDFQINGVGLSVISFLGYLQGKPFFFCSKFCESSIWKFLNFARLFLILF